MLQLCSCGGSFCLHVPSVCFVISCVKLVWTACALSHQAVLSTQLCSAGTDCMCPLCITACYALSVLSGTSAMLVLIWMCPLPFTLCHALSCNVLCAGLQVYNQIYNTTVAGNGGATSLNYTSPLLHTVVISGLTPDTKYYYQVGDGTVYSGTYNFTSLAAPSGSSAFAFYLDTDQTCIRVHVLLPMFLVQSTLHVHVPCLLVFFLADMFQDLLNICWGTSPPCWPP